MPEAVVERHAARLSSDHILGFACVAYAGLAFAVAPHYYPRFLIQYCLTAAGVLPLLLVLALAVGGALENPRSPLSGMRSVARASAVQAMGTLTLFVACISAFTTLKFAIPEIVPFYADPSLADLDEMIHGIAPWQLVHGWTPTWAYRAIEFLYSDLWFLQWFGMIAFMAFWRNRQARLRYLWAFALTMLAVGTVLATAMSSVGPIFYDQFHEGARFADLLAALRENGHEGDFLAYAAYLLESYELRDAAFGTGISAMPSVHVAVAVLNAWFLGSLDRRLGVLGWAFALVIMYGSVYSGWHYAVDGYLSAIVATVIWWGCSRFAYGPTIRAPLTARAAPAGR